VKQPAPTKVMQSSELARLAGISPDTLRYYERNRLLPAAHRSASGYRLFPPEALMRVQMIRGALSVGFSVKELGRIFSVRDEGGIPCHHVRKLGAEKLALVESQIEELKTKGRELKRTLVKWDQLLKCSAHGKRAGLLEVFTQAKENPE